MYDVSNILNSKYNKKIYLCGLKIHCTSKI